jgi:glycosyltransferase involved in cell wall biosynthesis
MNIAFLMQDIGAMYGAERATLDLITHLKKSGEQAQVLLIEEERLGLKRSDLRDALADSGIACTRLPTAAAFSPALVRRIRVAAEDAHAQVVHTIGPKATFHGYFAIRKTGIRLCSTVHGWLFRRDPKERFYEWLERKLLKRYDRVVVLSSYYRNYLSDSGFNIDRVAHIPSGLDVASLVTLAEARASLATARPFTIGMIGRLSAEKNHEMFLRAAKEIVGRGIRSRFVIAGLGPERARINDLIQRLGLEQSVELSGYLPVEQFMRQIHVLVQCSRIENLPYSILEAMAWCRPVVATDVGGLPDLVDDGKTGYLVPSDDHEALANRLCEMSAWPRLVEELGLAGRRKLEGQFTTGQMTARHRELYAAVTR